MPMVTRPVIYRDGTAVAIFYPLRNPTCPSATSAGGASVVTRMMRGRDIQIALVRRQSPTEAELRHVALLPTLIRCLACKLGVVGDKQYSLLVECVHGVWSEDPDPKVMAAQRLGSDIAACDLCGHVYLPNSSTWTFMASPGFGSSAQENGTFTFCGNGCRERARKMPLLAW